MTAGAAGSPDRIRGAARFDLGRLFAAPRPSLLPRTAAPRTRVTATRSPRPRRESAGCLPCPPPRPNQRPRRRSRPLYLPEKFTPYRFAMSAAFPLPDLPRDNPLIEERVALGKAFPRNRALPRRHPFLRFLPPRCHSPTRAGVGRASRGRPARATRCRCSTSRGRHFFWDGRAPIAARPGPDADPGPHRDGRTLTNVVAKLARRHPTTRRSLPRPSGPRKSPRKDRPRPRAVPADAHLLRLKIRSRACAARRRSARQRSAGLELFMTEI